MVASDGERVKRWFFDHPNLTFVLLSAFFAWMCLAFVTYLNNEQWGWAAVAFVAAVGVHFNARNWWRNQL